MAQESINTRAERAERLICNMYGITADQYAELWHETGCRSAQASHPLTSRHLIRSNYYWQRWAAKWVDMVEWFVGWNNPDKTVADLCRMASERHAQIMGNYDTTPLPNNWSNAER